MAYVDAQGFETVSNKDDLSLQSFVDTYGFNVFAKPSGVLTGTRSLAYENSLAAATDVSPSFLGTTTIQKNTGKLISDLWASGGFSFGSRAKFRDANPYTIGDIPLSDAGAAYARPIYTGRFAFGGGRIWSMKRFNASLATTLIASSVDNGVTWVETAAQPSIPNTCYISYVNGLVVASHTGGRFSYSSDNGATWTTVTYTAASNVGFPSSIMVYANNLYWIATGRGTASYGTVYTAASPDGPWTLVGTTNPQGTGSQLQIAHDPIRQRVFVFWRDGSTSSTSRTFLSSFDYAYAKTDNYVATSTGAFGIAGIAFSADTTGAIVITYTSGTVGVGTGTNPTAWTTVAAGTLGLPAVNGSTVAFDTTRQKFVVVSATGYTAVSVAAIPGVTASDWVTTQPVLSSVNLIGIEVLNGVLYTGGVGVLASRGDGWAVQFWGGNYSASNSSATNARASRLGIAAVNSSGRQGYVGAVFNGDMTSTQASLFLETNNAVTSSTALASSIVSTVTPWHYYVLIFTATATANQFTVQVVVDGAVQSALNATVQLAPTADVTSTLYWTVPVRDIGASVQPTLVEFDDIYVFDNSGTVNNTAMLDCVIMREASVADVQAQFTRTGGASNAAAAGSRAPSISPNSVSSVTNGAKDIYSTDQSIDISAYSVKAVTVEAVLSNTALSQSVVKVGIVSGSVGVDTGNVSIGIGTQVFAKKVQEIDPNTSAAWGRTAAKAANVTLEKVS